jgi:ferredoxin
MAEFAIVLSKTGVTLPVAANESIIDALDRANIHVARSCGEGTCGTCVVKVIDGTPDHRDSFLMGKRRRENKLICVCCSRSLTPTLSLEL